MIDTYGGRDKVIYDFHIYSIKTGSGLPDLRWRNKSNSKLVSAKVMKTLCYSAKLAAGLYVTSNPDLSKRLSIFSSKVSGARATLRLIDDLPMLRYTLEYGLGSMVGHCYLFAIIMRMPNQLDPMAFFFSLTHTGTRPNNVNNWCDCEYRWSCLLSSGKDLLASRTQVHIIRGSGQMGHHQFDILGGIDLLELNEVRVHIARVSIIYFHTKEIADKKLMAFEWSHE